MATGGASSFPATSAGDASARTWSGVVGGALWCGLWTTSWSTSTARFRRCVCHVLHGRSGPRLPPSERDHSAAPALAVVLQELRLWVRAQCLRLPALLMALPQECPQAQSGPSQTGSPNPPRGMNSSTNPDGLSGASGHGPGSASAFMDRLNANSATASSPPPVASAFEALGKAPMTTSSTSAPTDPAVAGDQVVKALTAALTGERKNI